MPNTPLNPDALAEAVNAAHGAVDWQMYEVTEYDLEDSVDVAVMAAISAYLAVAQPHTVQLVTIKLPKNPDHNPREKLTNACAVSPECTDSTGEHHTVAVYADDEVDALRTRFGHITRIERVSITAAQPVVNSVEELEALPVGSILLDRFAYPHHKYAQSKPDFKNLRTGHHIGRSEFYLPATIIFTPREQS